MQHASDCARNNAPAYRADLCDCGAEPSDEHDRWARDQWDKAYSRGNSGQARREAGRHMRRLIADIRRQMMAEREACASVIDDLANGCANHGAMTDASLYSVGAEAIRARSTLAR